MTIAGVLVFLLLVAAAVLRARQVITHNRENMTLTKTIISAVYHYNMGVLHGIIDPDPVLGRSCDYSSVLHNRYSLFSMFTRRPPPYRDKEKYQALMTYYEMLKGIDFRRLSDARPVVNTTHLAYMERQSKETDSIHSPLN